ncbi:unnamed protein product, partial [Ectocarpus fasciculatus]
DPIFRFRLPRGCAPVAFLPAISPGASGCLLSVSRVSSQASSFSRAFTSWSACLLSRKLCCCCAFDISSRLTAVDFYPRTISRATARRPGRGADGHRLRERDNNKQAGFPSLLASCR